MFLRIFQHLLPNAKAWRITVNKQLRQFFEGLTGLVSDVRNFIDLIWLDIFPQETRELDKWEAQFGLPNTVIDEQERRDRLDATWKALGGQSPRYIQDTLQAAGFDVYVHEWWQLPVIGGNPIPRNPLTYLNDGTGSIQYVMNDGAVASNDGNPEANDGASVGPTGFPLVNKIISPTVTTASDGYIGMNDGAVIALDGVQITAYSPKQYVVPSDQTKWPYFLYIGGQAFPDHAIVQSSRRNEFETLCLKICPTQQWLGMLIDYT